MKTFKIFAALGVLALLACTGENSSNVWNSAQYSSSDADAVESSSSVDAAESSSSSVENIAQSSSSVDNVTESSSSEAGGAQSSSATADTQWLHMGWLFCRCRRPKIRRMGESAQHHCGPRKRLGYVQVKNVPVAHERFDD